MAFLRYVINSSASDNASTLNNVFADLYAWATGTATSTSDFSSTYCNTASSEIEGTIPTNVYFDAYKNNNTGSSSDNIFRIAKYHSDWSSYNSSHPADKMFLYWSITGTYGARLRVGNRNNANYTPYPSTSYYNTGSTTAAYKTDLVPANCTIFMWLEEDYMACQIVDSNQNHSIFIGSFDQPRSEYADYVFDQDYDFANAVTVSALCHQSYNNTYNSSYNGFEIGVHDFIDQAQTQQAYLTNYSSGFNYFTSYSVNASYEIMTMYPPAWSVIDQVPTSSGVGHQLIPCFTSANAGNQSNGQYPIAARLKGLYRTSDEFAATGTSITYGGVNYRVCMMHKCGASSGNTYNTVNACYLLPVAS